MKEEGIKVKYYKPLDMFDSTTIFREEKEENGQKVVYLKGFNLYSRKIDVLAKVSYYEPNKKNKKKQRILESLKKEFGVK